MIQLSSKEIDFLLGELALPHFLLESLEKSRANDGLLEDDDADYLRDLCGEHLQVQGLGRNYEPNELGKQLEQLIDRLFIG